MFFRHSVKKLILDTECDDTTANAPNNSTGEHQVWVRSEIQRVGVDLHPLYELLLIQSSW